MVTNTITVEQLRRQRQEAAKQKRIKQAEFEKLRQKSISERKVKDALAASINRSGASIVVNQKTGTTRRFTARDIDLVNNRGTIKSGVTAVTAPVKTGGVQRQTFFERQGDKVTTGTLTKGKVEPLATIESLKRAKLGIQPIENTDILQAIKKAQQRKAAVAEVTSPTFVLERRGLVDKPSPLKINLKDFSDFQSKIKGTVQNLKVIKNTIQEKKKVADKIASVKKALQFPTQVNKFLKEQTDLFFRNWIGTPVSNDPLLKNTRAKDVKSVANAIRLFLPVINDDSISFYKKYAQGDKSKITNSEKISFLFDIVSAIPLARIAKFSKLIKPVKQFEKGLTGKVLTKLPGGKFFKNTFKTGTFTKRNISVATFSTMISIAKDVGFSARVINSVENLYNIDNKLLNSVASKLDLKNDKVLLNLYFNTIAEQEKGISQQRVASFLGVSDASQNAIRKGQNIFLQLLKNKGFSVKDSKKIVSNLEAKRHARLLGEILGLLRIEVSSELLSQRLLKRGIPKNIAVGLGGAREGLAMLAQDIFNKDYQLTPFDFLGAVVFGVTGSIFFSKTKLKDVRKVDLDKSLNKISKVWVKQLKPSKRNRFLTKAFARLNKVEKTKASTQTIRKAVRSLTRKEQDKVLKKYFNLALRSNRLKRIPKKKQVGLLRDPIGNIIDIWELPADTLVEVFGNLKSSILNKLKRKAVIKKSRVKRTRIKTLQKTKKQEQAKKKTVKKPKVKIDPRLTQAQKAKLRSTAKTPAQTKQIEKLIATADAVAIANVLSRAKARARAKAKARAKERAVAKTKSKAKTKTRTKAKTKTKTKTKAKAKAVTKAVTKTKTKTKTRTKTRVRTKVKSLRVPFFKLPRGKTVKEFTRGVLKKERKTKFTPSLDAILRDIKSQKLPKKAFTGLELRPIVIKTKNKLEKINKAKAEKKKSKIKRKK